MKDVPSVFNERSLFSFGVVTSIIVLTVYLTKLDGRVDAVAAPVSDYVKTSHKIDKRLQRIEIKLGIESKDE